MTDRPFPKRCGQCGEKAISLAFIPFDISISHDGSTYNVHLDNLSAPKCTNCGHVFIDDVAGKQIDNEFRRVAGILTPEEIRAGRIGVGYTNQQEFATCFGVSPCTVSRWENGSQVQQHVFDGWLRIFFSNPDVRRQLARLHGLVPKDPQPPLVTMVSLMVPYDQIKTSETLVKVSKFQWVSPIGDIQPKIGLVTPGSILNTSGTQQVSSPHPIEVELALRDKSYSSRPAINTAVIEEKK